jgi:hypothetical protein
MRRLLGTAAVLMAGMTPMLAQQDSAGSGWVPVLELRVLSATPQGTTPAASGDWTLGKDDKPIAATVWHGSTLCSIGIGGPETPPSAASAPTLWKMSGEFLGEDAGRYSVRITSAFERLAGQGAPPAAATQTLSLGEGDAVTLDALRGQTEGSCQVRTASLEVRLVMRPVVAQLARARYAAELWLVHTSPNGEERRERLVTNVDGSAAVPFMFNRLAFALPLVDPRQGDAYAFIDLAGTLRARARADGFVDLALNTQRMMFGLEDPARPRSASPVMRRKTLRVKNGETTAIEFPPPASGFHMLAFGSGWIGMVAPRSGSGASGSAGPSVEVKDERLVLYTSRFFKGHRTQLIVRLQRLQ